MWPCAPCAHAHVALANHRLSRICDVKAPSASRIRAIMLYATSKDGIRRVLDGIHYELQATDPTEMGFDVIQDRAKRYRNRVTDEEPGLFGDDALPRPPGIQKIAKSQHSSNSNTISDSNPTMFQQMLQQQYELDWKEKMKRIDREVNSRVALYDSQKVAEDLKVQQMSTDGMDPVDAAIINAQKARIQAL
ncbi:zinc finger CCCH domain-containing protein 14 [Tanacetum coccineum]